MFHRFGIEAVTIESVHKLTKRSRRRDFNLFTAGRILEGIYRSLNNLLERFHQSFFFYLLPGTSRYVSIGMYMPAFGFLAGGMLLMALKVSNIQSRGDPKNFYLLTGCSLPSSTTKKIFFGL